MTFILYNFVLLLLLPIVFVYMLYRIFVSGKSRKSWRQQIGLVRVPDSVRGKERVWIHAVSVGESVASAAVVSELKKLLPEVAVLISTTTSAGQEMARKSIKDADGFFYFPLDLALVVLSSLRRVKPRVFAGTDTEIWPNLLHFARKRGAKTAMINGTVSDKTLRGAKKVPWLYRWAMSNIDRFCMQSQADADRVISLGADPARVMVTGNCKADQAGEPLGEQEKAQLRNHYGVPEGARVFVAGSTNPGEDAPVLDAFCSARTECPNLRLIVAPRQVERRDEVLRLAVERGLSCGYRSDPSTISGNEDVIILDTFGELAHVYAIADVTFVGGSLIPRGCHSILQPIAQSKPVFFGPYTFKAKDLVAQAKAYEVGFEVKDGHELGERLSEFLADSDLLERVRHRCAEMMKANAGASERTAAALADLYREAVEQKP